ncbi:V-set and immunoglobulin domain-containing protein 10 Precursor [Channa argus]|nr:V-set and immunoglobulin domain-containing protein 10 Precursor [Channa argus]
MRKAVCVALLQVCLAATAALSGNDSSADTILKASPGDIAVLPCYTNGNVTPTSTTWMKNGTEIVVGNGSTPGQRLSVLHDGSLDVSMVIPGDEGSYLCNSTLPNNDTFQARVLLLVTSGPENVSTSIGPVSHLPNGTLFAHRGSTVVFNCSSSSYPAQRLTWALRGASTSNESLVSDSKSWLGYSIENIQPSAQGVYTCWANNTVSHEAANKSSELLVYYVPERQPECMCAAAQNSSQIQFNCSWFGAYPTPTLRWVEGQGAHGHTPEVTDNLSVTLERSQLSGGQTLKCMAEHPVLGTGEEKSCSLTLTVPRGHPDCNCIAAQDPSQIKFTCTWFGAVPTPKLHWEGGHSYPSEVTDNLSLTLNHSLLSSGRTMKCVAEHLLLDPGQERSCSLTLTPPYPKGDPLVTAVVGTSVTLTCTETTSFPPANTTWRKGLQQEEIVTGSKYVVSVEDADYKLTILNVSKDDEGVYFCRSENPLVVIELEVYLTVKTSSVNTGAIIGIVIAALILGTAFFVAKTVYSSRHQICLGGGFGQMGERGDVLTLVDSDDEQVFPDTVPQLPPVSNGHHTALVQIHRIPSSDHEDAGTADTSSQQQEDTVETEEPEDLVSF